MYAYHVQGILTFANFFVAAFILRYIWKFLTQTVKHKDRKPWELIYWASLFYFTNHILQLIPLYTERTPYIDYYMYPRLITQFLFSGLVLYTVVTQRHLITKQSRIVIRRRKNILEKRKK